MSIRFTKQAEHALMGPEPALQGPEFVPIITNVIRAFSWYGYFYSVKDARHWVTDYMLAHPETYTKNMISAFRHVPDDYIPMALCATAKMLLAGCPMLADSIPYVRRRVQELVAKDWYREGTQVRLHRDNPVIIRFETLLDEFFLTGYATLPDAYRVLQNLAPKQMEVQAAIEYYLPLKAELHSPDPQIKEGYKRLLRGQMKNYQQFVDDIISQCKLWVKNNKAERKITTISRPRRKRIKPTSQLVSKLRFKNSDPALKLVSVDPATIVGAHAILTFNTKYNQLTYLQAKDGGLSVKGTTVTNFNESASLRKKVRKPPVTIPLLLNSHRASVTKLIAGLTTKPMPPNGRINGDTILLKAYR